MTQLSEDDLQKYRRAQLLARETLAEISAFIKPGQSEASLMAHCRRLMDARGATGYWWYGVPALILAGPRLRDSMEGDAYRPSDTPIGTEDMVTIDLAPEIDGYWGDCARSFFLRDGRLVPAEEAGAEQAEGVAAEQALHARLRHVARPEMTFRDLYAQMDAEVRSLGFENLDFLSNYGHSIGSDVLRRSFIDHHCTHRLDSTPLFTFEPHIAKSGARWAFKYEEIYHFSRGELQLI